MNSGSKFSVFIAVSAILFLIISPDIPHFFYIIDYIILFFSVVSVIVFYITTPYAFDKSLKKINFWKEKYLEDDYYREHGFVDDDDDEIDVIDLSRMNMKQLYSELNYYIKNPSPITLSGKDKVNQMIAMDREKLFQLRQNIQSLSNMNIDLSELDASKILYKDWVNNIVEAQRDKAKKDREYLDAQHKLEVQRLNTENEKLKSDVAKYSIKLEKKHEEVEKQRAEIELIKTENEKKKSEINLEELTVRADVNFKEARTISEIDKADFIRNVLSAVDINALPEVLRSYVISSIVNPQHNNFDDFSMKEMINRFIERQEELKTQKMEQDVRYRQEEVNDINIKNDFQRNKNERERNKWQQN